MLCIWRAIQYPTVLCNATFFGFRPLIPSVSVRCGMQVVVWWYIHWFSLCCDSMMWCHEWCESQDQFQFHANDFVEHHSKILMTRLPHGFSRVPGELQISCPTASNHIHNQNHVLQTSFRLREEKKRLCSFGADSLVTNLECTLHTQDFHYSTWWFSFKIEKLKLFHTIVCVSIDSTRVDY